MILWKPRHWSPGAHQDSRTGCLWLASVPVSKNLSHTGFVHSLNKYLLRSYVPAKHRFAMKLISYNCQGLSGPFRGFTGSQVCIKFTKKDILSMLVKTTVSTVALPPSYFPAHWLMCHWETSV